MSDEKNSAVPVELRAQFMTIGLPKPKPELAPVTDINEYREGSQ